MELFEHQKFIQNNNFLLKDLSNESMTALQTFRLQSGKYIKAKDAGKPTEKLLNMLHRLSAKIVALLKADMGLQEEERKIEQAEEKAEVEQVEKKIDKAAEQLEQAEKEVDKVEDAIEKEIEKVEKAVPKNEEELPKKDADKEEPKDNEENKKPKQKEASPAPTTNEGILNELWENGIKEINVEDLKKRGFKFSYWGNIGENGGREGNFRLSKRAYEEIYKISKI